MDILFLTNIYNSSFFLDLQDQRVSQYEKRTTHSQVVRHNTDFPAKTKLGAQI